MSSSKNGLDLSFKEVTVLVDGVWDENSDNFELFDESIITKMDKMVEKLTLFSFKGIRKTISSVENNKIDTRR